MDLCSLVTGLLVILLISLLAKYAKLLSERSKLPPGPTPLPIIGTLYKMNLHDIVTSLVDLSKQYGDIFTVYEWNKPVIVVCGYKAIKETLIDKADEFSGRAYYPSFFDATKGNDVAFSNGEKWKELRRFAMQTMGNFGVGKSSIEEKIQEEALCLSDVLRKLNGSPVDPNHDIQRSVSNVICSVVFGNRFEYKDDNFQRLLDCIQDNFGIMSSCWGLLYNLCPSVMKHLPGPHRRIMENFIFLAGFITQKMEDNKKTLDSNNPRDYIDCFLIKMEKEGNNKATFYTPDSLVMSSLGLFFAGTESVSITLRFLLLLLMKHPSVAEKVYREIDDVIGQRPPQYEDRHNMPYTVAFIHEVQRYSDIIPMALPHKLTMDTQIRNYKFKKGTAFTPLLTSMHNDKTLFTNPEDFDPKHFLDENGDLKKNDSWLPFSAGKRLCLGKSLAVVELFIFTITLLQNFTIKSPVPPEKISMTPVGVGLGHIPPSFQAIFLPRSHS